MESDFEKINEKVHSEPSVINSQFHSQLNRNFPNTPVITFDIGNYIGKNIDDATKRNVILNPWNPPANYVFPYSIHKKKGVERKRFAAHKHLQAFKWLVYSDIAKGYFCKYCPFFVNCGLGGNQKNVPLKSLVSTPLKKFAKLFGTKDGFLSMHDKNKYHMEALEACKNFLETYDKPELNIENRINNARLEMIKHNRERLTPIVETTILLGQLNIPFRGHRDDGKITDDCSVVKQGNFRAILNYRAKIDAILRDHLASASSRATYISKTSQNELIECCKQVVLNKIISRIQNSCFYTVMFDETTDLANNAQLTLVLRYVSDGNVYEDFIEFIDARGEMNSDINEIEDDPENYKDDGENIFIDEEEVKLTGEKIGKVILKRIQNLNLDIKNCIGISTDGCSTMISEACGAVKTIKTMAVNAVFSPCQNHPLNLAVSKTSKVRLIRNTVDTLTDTTFFLTASSKRSAILRKKTDKKLIQLCETRWVERHDAVMQFRYLLPKILVVLESISKWKDRDAAIKANGLHRKLRNSGTIVAIVCLSDLLTCTHGLSTFLQSKNVDLKSARNELDICLKMLRRRRKESDKYFENIFDEVSGIAEEIGLKEIKIPRIASKQIHRENYNTKDPESYYRQSVYIPTLVGLISELEDRFSQNTLEIFNFSVLFPENNGFNDVEGIQNLVSKYSHFLEHSNELVVKELQTELERWCLKWQEDVNHALLPSISAHELLNKCNSIIYPRIHFFLRIFVTLSVSNASPERTFSTLKRLETWLRTTMTQERLTGLVLLHMHKEEEIDVNEVIDLYAKQKNRRHDFLI